MGEAKVIVICEKAIARSSDVAAWERCLPREGGRAVVASRKSGKRSMSSKSLPLRTLVRSSLGLMLLSLGSACGDDGTTATDGSTGEDTGGATMNATSGQTDDGSTSGNPTTGATGDTGSGTGDSASSGGDESTTGSVDHGALLFVELVPVNRVLEVDLNTPTVQPYEVRGHYEDGALVDLTDQATIDHSNPMVGSLAGSDLQIPAFSDTFIGTTILTAMVEGETAQAQLTLAAYAQTGAETDFFFVLPYEDPAGSQEKPLTFSTDIKELDVFISMDTTGSMGGPINNLISSLNSTVIPGIQGAIENTWFGVGAWMDYPVSPFGTPNCFSGNGTGYNTDQPFILLQAMTSSSVAAQNAVSDLANGSSSPIGCGSDGPESHIESLYQIATGDGLMGPGATNVPANHNGIGGVEFRDGALPIIVTITDNQSHDPGVPMCGFGTDYDNDPSVLAVAATRAETHAALEAICGRVVTVAVSNFDASCGPLADGVDFAEATGSLIPPQAWDLAPGGRPAGCPAGQCCTGQNGAGVPPNGDGLCPMVYRVDFGGAGIDDSMTDGVVMLANYALLGDHRGLGRGHRRRRRAAASGLQHRRLHQERGAAVARAGAAARRARPDPHARCLRERGAQHPGHLRGRGVQRLHRAHRSGAAVHGDHLGARR